MGSRLYNCWRINDRLMKRFLWPGHGPDEFIIIVVTGAHDARVRKRIAQLNFLRNFFFSLYSCFSPQLVQKFGIWVETRLIRRRVCMTYKKKKTPNTLRVRHP